MGSEIPGWGKKSRVRKRLWEPHAEPPASTFYQQLFASPWGKAVCLNGTSTTESKILPYYMGRWRPAIVLGGRHGSLKTTLEVNAEQVSQCDPVLRETTLMACDPEETINAHPSVL